MILWIPTLPAFNKRFAYPEEKAVVQTVETKQAVAEFSLFGEDMPIQLGAMASTHLNKATTKYIQSPPGRH